VILLPVNCLEDLVWSFKRLAFCCAKWQFEVEGLGCAVG